MAPIDFYFDFSSPYGYLASELIDGMAAKYDRPVVWHPMLVGVAFKATGSAPYPQVPMKGDYALRDFSRSARFLDIPYKHPSDFPLPTQHAARAFLWLQDRDPQQARAFAHATYRAYFTEGENIAELDRILQLATGVGANRAELGIALTGATLKERLKAEVELAMARGVFGSPFFIVEGEPFWGVDRLQHLEKWLKTGGF